jgi:hypothetical protein
VPAPFAARAARLSGSIDKAFGEELILAARRPVEDVNLPRVADPDRATLTVVGTFDDPTDAMTPDARGHASNHAQQRIATKPMATISDDQLPWAPRHGDLLTRVLTGDTYPVSRAKPNGMGRTVIFLTAKQ